MRPTTADISLWASVPAFAFDRCALRSDATTRSDDAPTLRAYRASDCTTLRPANADTVLALRPRDTTQTAQAGTYRLVAGIEHHHAVVPPHMKAQAVDLDEALSDNHTGETKRTEQLQTGRPEFGEELISGGNLEGAILL